MPRGSASRSLYDPNLGDAERGSLTSQSKMPEEPMYMQNSTEVYNDDDERDEILDPKLHHLPTRRNGTTHNDDGTKVQHGSWFRCCLTGICYTVAAVIVAVAIYVIVKNQKMAGTPKYVTNQLMAPPSEISSWCTKTDPNYNVEECEKACAPADCCDYPPTYDLSCLNGNELMCFEYHKSCLNLALGDAAGGEQPTVPSIPSAPADLVTTCSFINLDTNPDMMEQCEIDCTPGECCYMEGVPPCLSQEQCGGYVPCFNLRAYQNIEDGDFESEPASSFDEGEGDEEPELESASDVSEEEESVSDLMGGEGGDDMDEGDVGQSEPEPEEDVTEIVDTNDAANPNYDPALDEAKANAKQVVAGLLDDDDQIQDYQAQIEMAENAEEIQDILNEVATVGSTTVDTSNGDNVIPDAGQFPIDNVENQPEFPIDDVTDAAASASDGESGLDDAESASESDESASDQQSDESASDGQI